MSHRDRLVFLALIGAGPLCGALLGASGVPAALSIAAGLLLVLALPGLAFQRALFPSGSLDVPTTVTMILGLSLTLSILGGFVLNGTPAGLNASGWGVLLGGATLVLAVVGWVRFTWQEWHAGPVPTRRPDIAPESGTAIETEAATAATAVTSAPASASVTGGLEADLHASSNRAVPRIPRLQQGMIAVAVILVVVALGVARIGVDRQPHDGFAELWMLANPPGAVRVGVSNHEGAEESYRVLLAVDGVQMPPLDGVSLADGQQTEIVVDLPAASPTPGPSAGDVAGAQGRTRVVTAALFHDGESQAFRTARITVPVP